MDKQNPAPQRTPARRSLAAVDKNVRGCRRIVASPSHLLMLEDHRAQRRYDQIQRMRPPVGRDFLRVGAAQISVAGAAVGFRVTVQNFAPMTGIGNANAVVMARDWSEVENGNDDFIPSPRFPHEAQHALLPVAAVDPLKTS